MMVWYKTECTLKVKTRWKIETHPIILLAYAYNYIVRLRKVRMFEPLFVCCAFELNCSLQSFATTPTLMFAWSCTLVQSKHVVNNVIVFQKSWGCVVGCFCLISQHTIQVYENNYGVCYDMLLQLNLIFT